MPQSTPTPSQEPAGGTPSYETYAGNPAENYERYFVPAIGRPLATDRVEAAAPARGERVLDIACGTGVVARLAAQRVGAEGSVHGLDVNPGMLAVARAVAPADAPLDWHEASAEDLPLPDDAYDVVLCQMGLQFFPDREAALREMRRVAVAGGRLALNVPGPTPDMMTVLAEALARHVDPALGGFVHTVFSIDDPGQLRRMLEAAGFDDVAVEREERTLRLPPPAAFLWQYVCSTPLAQAVAQADPRARDAVQRDVVPRWDEFVDGGATVMGVGMLLGTARVH